MLGSINPDAGLYPHPPQPQQNALAGNPIAVMGQLNALKAFNAKQAVGKAFQGALNPDGTIDTARLSTGLQDPAAALAAPQGISTMLAQRGQQISNATGAFTLAAGQNQAIQSTLGALADSNPTKDDVTNYAVTLARNTGIPTSVVTGWLAGLPSEPAALKQALLTQRNAALGSAGVSGRTQGPVSPEGAPTQISTGQANVASGAPQGGIATSLPPGQAEALATNQGAYVKDQQSSATTLANVRQLQNALPLISGLNSTNFGAGSPQLAQLKSVLTFAGVMKPDDSSLPTREEAKKYLLKYAQGAINAGRSDAALSTAINSNPNIDLTQPANMSLIKNQIGMDRMDAAIPVAFGASNPNPSQKANYLNYKAQFYQNNDPRAFSWDLMSPDERGQLVSSLGVPPAAISNPQALKTWLSTAPANKKAAYLKFAHSYDLAKQSGLITPEQQPNAQQ